MKDKSIKAHISAVNAEPANDANTSKHLSSKNHFLPSSTYPPMTEQFVAPPPHIWARIEKVLDEQDQTKLHLQSAKAIVLPICQPVQKKKFRAVYTVLGATLAMCFIRYFF